MKTLKTVIAASVLLVAAGASADVLLPNPFSNLNSAVNAAKLAKTATARKAAICKIDNELAAVLPWYFVRAGC